MNSASGQEKSGEMKGSQKEIYWRTVLPDRRGGSSRILPSFTLSTEDRASTFMPVLLECKGFVSAGYSSNITLSFPKNFEF